MLPLKTRSSDCYEFSLLFPKTPPELVRWSSCRLECCGVESPQDWANFPSNGTLPLSCCERTATECRIELAFPSSCLDRVFESFARGIKITYILAFCIAVIEAVGIIFASVLISSIKNERRRHRYAKYTRSS